MQQCRSNVHRSTPIFKNFVPTFQRDIHHGYAHCGILRRLRSTRPTSHSTPSLSTSSEGLYGRSSKSKLAVRQHATDMGWRKISYAREVVEEYGSPSKTQSWLGLLLVCLDDKAIHNRPEGTHSYLDEWPKCTRNWRSQEFSSVGFDNGTDITRHGWL